jgi:nitric oxide reductase subunit B
MVGAWNQMIYGTSLFLMVKISGDERIAKGKIVFFFYMLGLTNLMFNWGHHIYNVPGASWIRDTSYIISMTEWVFLIRMIQGFNSKLDERKKFRHLIAYRFIIAAEFWVFMNLLLAIAMSIPAINRYTHGTHITVAHAMGTTIGINSMILLASYTYMLDIDSKKVGVRQILGGCYWLAQYSLMAFWLSLVVAGVIKAYGATVKEMTNFQEIMKPVLPAIKAFSLCGIGLLFSLGVIAVTYIWYATTFDIEKK